MPRKKKNTGEMKKTTVRLAAFPVRGTTSFVQAGIRATGFRYLTETGRPAFPCTRHSGANGRRVPFSEHLLTVAGAAHVGRDRRLRVSRLTAHQTDVRAPERRHCKRGIQNRAKSGRTKRVFLANCIKKHTLSNRPQPKYLYTAQTPSGAIPVHTR